jgi:DNA-binding NtrC family response regulator
MHMTEMVAPKTAPELITHDDEGLASRSTARILITAVASEEAEACARRIHGRSLRRGSPFVRAEAGDFPVEADLLRDTCTHLLDDAAGGMIFVNDIEAMPPLVQDVFLELLGVLEAARGATIAVRLVSGTTVSLLDRIAAGTFAESLFYRLNIIHLLPLAAARIDRCEGVGHNSPDDRVTTFQIATCTTGIRVQP